MGAEQSAEAPGDVTARVEEESAKQEPAPMPKSVDELDGDQIALLLEAIIKDFAAKNGGAVIQKGALVKQADAFISKHGISGTLSEGRSQIVEETVKMLMERYAD